MIVEIFRQLRAQRLIALVVMAAHDSLFKQHMLSVLWQLPPAFQDGIAERARETLPIYVEDR
jgi:hypothetical protein